MSSDEPPRVAERPIVAAVARAARGGHGAGIPQPATARPIDDEGSWDAAPPEACEAALEQAVALLRGRRVAVLTGAGLSTASGIPDYRGPETRRRARNPLQHRDFVGDPAMRRRYWARATVGWPTFRAAAPNVAHLALAAWQRAGATTGLITQNVDRLHQRAGSAPVIELHGALEEVRCLACGAIEPRDQVHARTLARNPQWAARMLEQPDTAPDGDAELAAEQLETFEPVDCTVCGGPLKPNVVFFGDSVPIARVEAAYAAVAAAEALLVAGSSLAVFSGYRFVRAAAKAGTPVVIVNLGPSRGDPHADVRVAADVTWVLPQLIARLGVRGDAR